VKLHKDFGNIASRFNAWQQFQWALALLQLLCSMFAVSGVVFIRRRFGERYLSPVNLFFGYSVVAPLALGGGLIHYGAHGGFSAFMVAVWLAFIGASIYHRLEINRKNRLGIPWHSMFMGESILPLPVSAERMHKVIEPLVFLVAAVVMFKIALVVAIWAALCSVSILISNHLIYHFERERFLDTRDAQIEAKALSDAIAGKPARETNGFVFAESNVRMVRQDATLRAAFDGLSAEMKGMLTASV